MGDGIASGKTRDFTIRATVYANAYCGYPVHSSNFGRVESDPSDASKGVFAAVAGTPSHPTLPRGSSNDLALGHCPEYLA